MNEVNEPKAQLEAVPLDCRVSDNLKWMPIIGTPLQLSARVLSEEWAKRNHGQSLQRLAERGGLSLCEAAAVAGRRAWHKLSADDAIKELKRAAERGR